MVKLREFIFLLVLLIFASSISSAIGIKNQNVWLMDKDRNGVLSFTEFSLKGERWFSALDQNSDGNLTRTELDNEEAIIGKKKLSRIADRLDRNDDNKVDKKEFTHSKGIPRNRYKPKNNFMMGTSYKERKEISEAIFKVIDRDNNGFLSTNELAEGSKVGPGIARKLKFQQLDSDGNNRISREEFLSPLKERFAKADKNSDDVLDRREVKSSFRQKRKGKTSLKKKSEPWKEKPFVHKDKKNK